MNVDLACSGVDRAGAEPEAELEVGPEPESKAVKKKNKKARAKARAAAMVPSGPSNAEQAQQIRDIMGVSICRTLNLVPLQMKE